MPDSQERLLHATLRLEDLDPAAQHTMAPGCKAAAVATDAPLALGLLSSESAPVEQSAAQHAALDIAAASLPEAAVGSGRCGDPSSNDEVSSSGGNNHTGSDSGSASGSSGTSRASSAWLLGQLWDSTEVGRGGNQTAQAGHVVSDMQRPAAQAVPAAHPMETVSPVAPQPMQPQLPAANAELASTGVIRHHADAASALAAAANAASALQLPKGPTPGSRQHCDSGTCQPGSRKHRHGGKKQAQAAAARRAEFLAAWRLAVWRAEEEKRFIAQLKVLSAVKKDML